MSGPGGGQPPGGGDPGAAGVGAHQVPDNYEFNLDGVKAELNTKLLELHTLKDVYDTSTYEPDILISNKSEWTAEVKSAYMDVMKVVTSNLTKTETNQADKVVLNTALNAAKNEFTSFLTAFTRKCAVNGGGVAAAPGLGPHVQMPGQQPQQPIPGLPNHSQNLSGSSDNSVQAQAAENARLANIEVNVTSEKVSDLAKSLSSEIRRFTDCSLAPNHEVEEAMQKIADWEKKVSTLKEQYWEIKTKTQCHGLNNSKLAQAEATVNTAVAEADLAITNLRHEDSTRCLYSLSQSKSANVKYPSFSGSDKEDYLKWEKEIKSAFIKNKVRLEDQVKILRENLTGNALKMIPYTMTDIDTAYTTLSGIYGEASKVMTTRKDKLFSLGQLPPDPRTRSATHIRNQLEWLLTAENLFEEMFEIADKSEDLSRAFINPDCFKDILDLFPIKVSTHISKVRGGLHTQYESLFTWITDKRDELQQTLKLIGSKSEKNTEKEKPKNKTANVTFKPAQRHEDCRICQKLDSEGSTEDLYDGHTNDVASGCPAFVAMDTDSRLRYAKKARLCIYCLDAKYIYRGPGSRHVNCVAFQKKCFFTCLDPSCKVHFLLCKTHMSQNKQKLDQTKQYWEGKGKHFATTFVMSSPDQSLMFSGLGAGSPVNTPAPDLIPHEDEECSPKQKHNDNIETVSDSDSEAPSPAVPRVVVNSDPALDKENLSPPPVPSIQVRMFEAAEKLIEEAGPDVIVHPLPPGEPLFMFSQAVGKTRPLNVFYDSGASHMMTAEAAVPEMDAVKIQEGPLQINAAGDTVVRVNDEYLFTMQKTDGSRQIMIGVTADSLTAPFPLVSTKAAHKDIVKNTPKHKRGKVAQLRVPEVVGGAVDILLGTCFSACFPEIVHQLPSGLFIAKLRLKSHDGVTTACLGGPHQTFTAMVNQCGDVSRAMSVFIAGLQSFHELGPPKIKGMTMTFNDLDLAHELNKSEVIELTGDPDEASDDKDETDVPECDVAASSVSSVAGFSLQCSSCACDVMEDPSDILKALTDDIGVTKVKAIAAFNTSGNDKSLNDLKTVVKIMEQGIDIQYRCPKCRDCWGCKSGPTTERVSLREEQEDDIIRDSVKLDFENKQITAVLPLRGDPAQLLAPNREIAAKVLDQQCRKVKDDEETKAMVIKSFAKLVDNKYAVEFKELTPEQQQMILSKAPQLYFPWRIQFKESLSTPARCVMDGSSKTPVLENGVGGRCLNDLCMKGTISTLNLLKMLLRFQTGSKALCGDIRQFYNRIGLNPDQWHLQRILFKPDMDIEAEVKEYVITSLIYGVRSVSALSERAKIDLAESVRESNPRLAELITEATFCDDIADSDNTIEIMEKLKAECDELFGSVGLQCKGWSVSGKDPHPDVTADGVHVGVGGIVWAPKVDAIEIKIPPLHFGKKMRGRLQIGTEVFDGSFQDLEKFVPKTLTRRMLVSKFSALFDPLGKFVPLTASMKVHLRKVVKETIGWDDSVFPELRQTWVTNLWKLYKMQGLKFNRATIPADAVDTKLELFVCVDAAEVKVAGIWGRFLRRNGTYSCQLIIGRALLSSLESTIPKQELESLVIGSNLLWIVRDSLKDWISDYKVFSDSAISLCWLTNESKRLSIFHRNRVNQFRLNTDVTKLFFLRGEFNPSDNGTRADKVSENCVGPDSPWEKGLEWMNESLEKAIDADIIKPASELKLVDKEEEEFNKGFIIEKDLEVLVRGHYLDGGKGMKFNQFNKERVEKFQLRAFESKYILFPSCSFDKLIRITTLVFKFVRKCSAKLKKKKLQDVSKKAALLPEPVKSQFVGLSWEADSVGDVDSPENKMVEVDNVDIERALVYWYSKATREVKNHYSAEYVAKVGVEKEGILFCRSRIIDGQRLLQAAEFSADSIGSEIGLHLLTPLIERHSPIALSIALYIHQNIAKHAGAETCFRLSLTYCHILQGASLFREIGRMCVKCRIVRKKYLEVVMGPVSDHQLSMAGAWNVAYLDLDGPYLTLVPGYERETRLRKCLAAKNYIMMFADPISKLLNMQVIEAKNTAAIIEGLTRFGCECGFPSILVMDKESSFMKVVKEAEVNLHDLNLQVYKEHGIRFEVAPVGAHNFHGLVERKIRTAQDCFKRMDLQSQKLHATGLQTFAKLVENQMNNLPLGFSFENSDNNTPLLKIITPNMLRLGRLNSRALQGPIRLPSGPRDMMQKVTMLYDAFYKLWNTVMVPRLIPQPKWFKSDEDLKVDTVVYFQKVENDISSVWTVGQIDSFVRGKDGKIRRVEVRYNNHSESIPRKSERSVRSLVRLFHIEDEYWVDDINQAEKLFKELNLLAAPNVDELAADNAEASGSDVASSGAVSAAIRRSCKCCCAAHCSLSVHSVTGQLSGVSLTSLYSSVKPDMSHAVPFTKEDVSRADFSISSNGLVDAVVKDELYAVITSLETQFDLE